MSRNLFVDARMQAFWKEAIEKEAKSRLHSFKNLKGQPRCQGRQFEVFRKKIEEGRPSDAILQRLPPIAVETRHCRKKADFNEIFDFEKSEAVVSLPEMRPVSPLVRRTLYDGFTKEGKGRDIYLRQRYDKPPEDKFTFPSCTSWDYGWRLKDSYEGEDKKRSEFGHYCIMEKNFYSRNGPQSSCSNTH
ncbi:unnamed protein product [Candidula unifasciata]|uniref:Sperm microtubule inner protein 1 C-terminal domain-containing protein n=1 Tax=Candidula unifasciata TaxID=100452 RepID=A0A8S3ZTN8_9EUPU|nr:unnamed protein product [Candidula unifasciata]